MYFRQGNSFRRKGLGEIAAYRLVPFLTHGTTSISLQPLLYMQEPVVKVVDG